MASTGAGARRRRVRSPRRLAVAAGRQAILIAVAAIFLFPILLIISTALKSPIDALLDPFGVFTSWHPANFVDAWTLGGFGHYFWTTVEITLPTVGLVVAVSVPAGYALARLHVPGRRSLYYLFIAGLMVPFFAVMIPLFYELKGMGLIGSIWGVILPGVAGVQGFGIPLGVFLMRSFFVDLPDELSEAARIDGSSELSVFLRIMLPLSWPGVSILVVFVFFQSWNTFLLPLLYLPGAEHQTLATGVYEFSTGRTRETALLAAGALIMIVPVLLVFLAFQRRVVRGMLAGAVKG
jgi:raffinose/stachyose/melibiose transport system permease protein